MKGWATWICHEAKLPIRAARRAAFLGQMALAVGVTADQAAVGWPSVAGALRRWSMSRMWICLLSSSIVYRTRYSPRRARQCPSKGLRNGAPTLRGSSASGPRMNS